MRTATTPMALGLTAAPVSLGVWTAEARQPAGESTLEGVWVLNASLSDEMPKPSAAGGDNSRAVRDDARRGSGPGVGGGFFGRGPGGGRGGDRPDPEKMAANRKGMQSAMEDLTTASRRMTIVVTDRGEVLTTYADGRVMRLIPDDREHSGLAGTSMRVTRKTRWQGNQLVTEVELESRTKFQLHQTHQTDPDGRVLRVTSRFEGDRFEDNEDQEFRLVYEREEAF